MALALSRGLSLTRRHSLHYHRRLLAGQRVPVPTFQGVRCMAAVASKYQHLVSSGVLHPSKTQQGLINSLDALAQRLEETMPSTSTHSPRSTSGFLSGLFGGAAPAPAPVPASQKLKSFYIWGGVGVGKTYCMDLFYREVKIPKKRRIHFHHFMLEVHSRIHRWRSTHSGDPVIPVANDIADETKLLCFDEFQVSDIADATIMSRLFSTLFDRGVVMVATSNRPPKDLYKNGLNRELFLPFIDVLYKEADVLELEGDASSLKHHHHHHHTHHHVHKSNGNGSSHHSHHSTESHSHGNPMGSGQPPHAAAASSSQQRQGPTVSEEDRGKSGPLDYRKLGEAQGTPVPGVLNHPLNAKAYAAVDAMFEHCAGVAFQDPRVQPQELHIAMHGRTIHVPAAYDGVCRWNFKDLCGKALGAADYIAIAEKFHTIVVDDIPLLTENEAPMAKRFITFIDVLYEHKIRIIASAEGDAEHIFHGLDRQYEASTADHEDIYREEKEGEATRAARTAAAKQVKRGELSGMTDLAFAYHRAVSRLIEMQSEKFWALVGQVEIPSPPVVKE